jgi:phosphatidylglycerol:prolipoprotein diacylglycerol transferase
MTFAIPFPAIDPVLIELGPLQIRWYALAYLGGIMLGWWYMGRLAQNQTIHGGRPSPIRAGHLDDFLFFATLGIILGGRLGYVLFYKPAYYMQNPGEILQVWQGGMSFHGGAIGLLVATALVARYKRIPILMLGDLAVAAAPIGLFFGRLANFINGELWGRVTDVPWAMVFPFAGPDPRHPSQLYQAALEGLALFVILRILTHKFGALQRPGLVTGAFFIGYGVMRIISEQFREPDAHLGFILPGMTMGMALSLPMIVLGAALAYWAYKSSRMPAPFPRTDADDDSPNK